MTLPVMLIIVTATVHKVIIVYYRFSINRDNKLTKGSERSYI